MWTVCVPSLSSRSSGERTPALAARHRNSRTKTCIDHFHCHRHRHRHRRYSHHHVSRHRCPTGTAPSPNPKLLPPPPKPPSPPPPSLSLSPHDHSTRNDRSLSAAPIPHQMSRGLHPFDTTAASRVRGLEGARLVDHVLWNKLRAQADSAQQGSTHQVYHSSVLMPRRWGPEGTQTTHLAPRCRPRAQQENASPVAQKLSLKPTRCCDKQKPASFPSSLTSRPTLPPLASPSFSTFPNRKSASVHSCSAHVPELTE
eukprot:1596143-Pleurochrysis_carterae.AAC.2